jgi:hypothetical protein
VFERVPSFTAFAEFGRPMAFTEFAENVPCALRNAERIGDEDIIEISF